MRNLATGPAARSPRVPGLRRGWGRAACVGIVMLAGTFASAVQAQIRPYPDLNAAVHGLALELVHEGKLEGKKVLVSPRYFFERGDRAQSAAVGAPGRDIRLRAQGSRGGGGVGQ